MKIAILADALVNKGGIEREILTLLKHFDADVYAGMYRPDVTFQEFGRYRINSPDRPKTLPQRLAALYIRRYFSRLRLDGYDCYISFGSSSLNALKRHHPNIWYCNAPIRWMYDLYEDELRKFGVIKRQAFKSMVFFLKKNDQGCARAVDLILVNSDNVRNRVKKFYGLDSRIVYPPTDTDFFKYRKSGDFYLSTGRLDPIKRVHLVVEAFKRMPDKRLIVAGGGPDEQRIRVLAENSPNIKVLGWTENNKLRELYGDCIACLYLSYKEDFGMIPVESMSAGKPCIATNDGGFRETIIHRKTGYLVDNPEDIREIIAAVNWLSKEKAISMRKACEERAQLFSEEKFIDGIKKAVMDVKNG